MWVIQPKFSQNRSFAYLTSRQIADRCLAEEERLAHENGGELYVLEEIYGEYKQIEFRDFFSILSILSQQILFEFFRSNTIPVHYREIFTDREGAQRTHSEECGTWFFEILRAPRTILQTIEAQFVWRHPAV